MDIATPSYDRKNIFLLPIPMLPIVTPSLKHLYKKINIDHFRNGGDILVKHICGHGYIVVLTSTSNGWT
jgi:hypothetical protein